MTYDAARPRYTLPFAGKEYELVGSFELIESVEYALKDGIGSIVVNVVNGMPAHDLAKLIAAILTACDSPMNVKAASEILWNQVGLSGDENSLLRFNLYAFLSICISRPGDREAKSQEMGETLRKLIARSASRGKRTRSSASESSVGAPGNSGEPASGT